MQTMSCGEGVTGGLVEAFFSSEGSRPQLLGQRHKSLYDLYCGQHLSPLLCKVDCVMWHTSWISPTLYMLMQGNAVSDPTLLYL